MLAACDLGFQFGRQSLSTFALVMNLAEGAKKSRDIGDNLRLGDEHGSELANRAGVALEVLFEIHVHEIGTKRSNRVDRRIFRSTDSRQAEAGREDAVVCHRDHVAAGAEREECFGERGDERDDASRPGPKFEWTPQYVANHRRSLEHS